MPELDPEMAAILEMLAEKNLPPYPTMSAAEARAASVERQRFWNEDAPELASVRDLELPGPRGARRLRLYDPAPERTPKPGVLFLHGGGFVVCGIETHDGICRRLARASGLTIASLDYGLAPEHPFPEPIDDAVAGFAWLHEQAQGLGLDPQRLGVAGDSAGASLALNVAFDARDRGRPGPKAAALVYGTFDTRLDTASHKAFGNGDHFLTTESMRWFLDHYLPEPWMWRDPRAKLVDADLGRLPPLYVSIAELDPLKDDGLLFLERLEATDTEVERHLWHGVTHGCLPMSRMLTKADRFITEIATFLERRLG